MIRLDLGEEPSALALARERHLPRAMKAFDDHGAGHPDFTSTLTGYDAGSGDASVKRVLHQRQQGKCAWCESREDWRRRDVDHVRPKAGADDAPGAQWLGGPLTRVRSAEHYWWLTWTWSNLVFACVRCNGAKGCWFPMEAGAARVVAPARPIPRDIEWSNHDPGEERAMLLDPRRDDPLDHLTWGPVDRMPAPADWKWTVRGTTARGRATIEVLKLVGANEEVNAHLRRAVLPSWGEVVRHLEADRRGDAAETWSRLVERVVDDDASPFRAASWCALRELVPDELRPVLGLREVRRPELSWMPG